MGIRNSRRSGVRSRRFSSEWGIAMTRTEHTYLGIALAAALGCQAAGPSGPPRPTEVVPPQGYEGAETLVEILGSDFHVRAVQQTGSSDSSVDAGYRASIGGVALQDVVWV